MENTKYDYLNVKDFELYSLAFPEIWKRLSNDAVFIHRVFGEGTLIGFELKESSVVEINFRKEGVKKLSAQPFSKFFSAIMLELSLLLEVNDWLQNRKSMPHRNEKKADTIRQLSISQTVVKLPEPNTIEVEYKLCQKNRVLCPFCRQDLAKNWLRRHVRKLHWREFIKWYKRPKYYVIKKEGGNLVCPYCQKLSEPENMQGHHYQAHSKLPIPKSYLKTDIQYIEETRYLMTQEEWEAIQEGKPKIIYVERIG